MNERTDEGIDHEREDQRNYEPPEGETPYEHIEFMGRINGELEDLPNWETKGVPFLQSFVAWIERERLNFAEFQLMADYLRSRSTKYIADRFDYCATMKTAWLRGYVKLFESNDESRYPGNARRY